MQGQQKPALKDFNESAKQHTSSAKPSGVASDEVAKQHTLSVKSSDFVSDESDGKYRFSGNTSRYLFIKLIAIDDRDTYYL
jgi:hypothetical protein